MRRRAESLPMLGATRRADEDGEAIVRSSASARMADSKVARSIRRPGGTDL
jgi:hypothetical protein